MSKQTALAERCDVAYAMSLLGGKWKMAIIWKLLEGTYRFSELKRQLTGISEGVLIVQLKELEHDGLIKRIPYDVIPPRVEYNLTQSTKELAPVLKAMDAWGKMQRERLLTDK